MKSSGVKRPTHRCKKGIALLMTSAMLAGSGISGSSMTAEAAPGVFRRAWEHEESDIGDRCASDGHPQQRGKP